jgi:hypothetical protein
MMKDGRSAVIRQIPENKTLLPLVAAAQAGEVAQENIGFKNFNSRLVRELLLKHPCQLTVDFDGDDLLGSRRQKLGHRPTPWADLADQIIRLYCQPLDNSALKPPVAEEMLAKLGTSRAGHGKRLYLNARTQCLFMTA